MVVVGLLGIAAGYGLIWFTRRKQKQAAQKRNLYQVTKEKKISRMDKLKLSMRDPYTGDKKGAYPGARNRKRH